MPSKATKRRNAKKIPQQIGGDAVIRAYHRMTRQLVILRRRVNARIPAWRAAMASGVGWSQQTDEIRLDFECYITILTRFFRLCRTITKLPDFGDEPIVRQVREIRDRIVEHGFDDESGQGDRGFFCGDQGPMLVMKGGIPCLSMAQIDDGVSDLLDRHKLQVAQIAFSHFSPLTGIGDLRAELGVPPLTTEESLSHERFLLEFRQNNIRPESSATGVQRESLTGEQGTVRSDQLESANSPNPGITMESVMLTEAEANRVWEKMYAAEVRSLYFGNLAARYTREKQILTGLSFLLSSGAAAMIAAKLPSFIPIISASVSALLMAYSIAVSLDRKAALMAKLQYQWSQIASDLERLWNCWYEDGAEAQLEEILKFSREASQAGSTEAPYDEALMEKWQKRVNLLRGIENAA